MAMRDVKCIVDVQDHRGGRFHITPAPDIGQRIGEADNLPQRGGVLPARNCGLRTQIAARIRQPSAGEFEGGIGAQPIEVIAVRITAAAGWRLFLAEKRRC